MMAQKKEILLVHEQLAFRSVRVLCPVPKRISTQDSVFHSSEKKLTCNSCCQICCNWQMQPRLQIQPPRRKISELQHQSTPEISRKSHYFLLHMYLDYSSGWEGLKNPGNILKIKYMIWSGDGQSWKSHFPTRQVRFSLESPSLGYSWVLWRNSMNHLKPWFSKKANKPKVWARMLMGQ